ncbi:MAG: hypothetical protein V2A74_12435 [bacterium]
MKLQSNLSPKRVLLIFALTIGIAAIAFGSLPSTNPAGATLVRASAETWSGSTQTNTAGATVAVAGAADSSIDTTNPLGATAFLGQFDPVANPAAPGRQGWIAR